jgi:hypothetical protein
MESIKHDPRGLMNYCRRMGSSQHTKTNGSKTLTDTGTSTIVSSVLTSWFCSVAGGNSSTPQHDTFRELLDLGVSVVFPLLTNHPSACRKRISSETLLITAIVAMLFAASLIAPQVGSTHNAERVGAALTGQPMSTAKLVRGPSRLASFDSDRLEVADLSKHLLFAGKSSRTILLPMEALLARGRVRKPGRNLPLHSLFEPLLR